MYTNPMLMNKDNSRLVLVLLCRTYSSSPVEYFRLNEEK